MVEYGSNDAAAANRYDKGGTWTITAGQTSVNVAHGLGLVPTKYNISPTNATAVDAYVSAVDATNITVSIEFAQGSDATGSWRAS